MEKLNKEQSYHVDNQELHSNYFGYNENENSNCIFESKNNKKHRKGVSKMTKTTTQSSIQQTSAKFLTNEANYKGVNKMAKQIALANETQTESSTVFINETDSEKAQIQRLTEDMPSDLHKEFKVWCVLYGKKMNDVVRDLLRDTIRNSEQNLNKIEAAELSHGRTKILALN